MIAVDTSVIIAIALDEPEAEDFKAVLRENAVFIGWPTLFETRIVLSVKGFSNADRIVTRLAETPSVTVIPFDQKHHEAAERAYQQFGKGRHPAALNMGDCLSYAVSAVTKAPLLFKGDEFAKTDLNQHPKASKKGRNS